MKRTIIAIALMLFVSSAFAQMSGQRAKVTDLSWSTSTHKGANNKDSAFVHTGGGVCDSTKWYMTGDSTVSQGCYVNMYLDAGTANAAKVEVQYSILNPTTKAYIIVPVVSLTTVKLDSLSQVNAKSPSASTLFFRTPRGATHMRFIVTHAAGNLAIVHQDGQLVQPAY